MNQTFETAIKESTNPSSQNISGNCWCVVGTVDLGDYMLSQNFFNGIKVLIDRPHVINPKLLAAETVSNEDIPFVNSRLSDFLITGEFCEDSIKEVLKNIDSSDKPAFLNIEKNQGQVKIRHVLPKRFNMYEEVLEVVVLDYFEESASFFPKKSDVLKSPLIPSFPYKFRLIDKRIQLEMLKYFEDETPQTSVSGKWLLEKVLPRVAKWSKDIPKHPILPSIQLLAAKDYNKTLHYLKGKYAKQFVEIWPLYNITDPGKYVYEDLSIAAYLITLWDQERKVLNITKKQTFVDLGCGNGLLDHILQSEGHKGVGIDLRKRKIWDAYGPETNLIESTFEPSDKELYPEYDWIIGNHPDELTPWIPVIAARSSYNMRVFLLPCCFYTFDGKYVRNHGNFTQYQSYINFMKTLCETMGFDVQLDKLRIPSTKRTCLVCFSRTYAQEDEAKMEINRKEFIKDNSKNTETTLPSIADKKPADETKENNVFGGISDCSRNAIDTDSKLAADFNLSIECSQDCSKTTNNPKWVTGFIPRESVECSQNCTSLDKKIIDEAVMTIVNTLLATENYITIKQESGDLLWNKGGIIKIADIFNLLNQQALLKMKSQHGGFRTLIRNHRNVFKVSKEDIQLRIPSIIGSPDPEFAMMGKRKQKGYRKRVKKNQQDEHNKKECFFHFHHPQGCPLSSTECTFSHEELPMR